MITARVRQPRLIAIRIVLILAIVCAACLCWFFVRAEQWDTPPLIPVLVLSEIPFVAILLLVTRKRDEKQIACGTGMSFGVGALGALVVPLLFLAAEFTLWDHLIYRNLVWLSRILPGAFVISLLLLIFSWRPGKKRRPIFFGGFAMVVAFLVLAVLATSHMTIAGSGEQKSKNAWVFPHVQANRAVISLTACLIRYHSANPEKEYPNSLAKARSDWGCDAAAWHPAEYVLAYTPQADAVTGRIIDFQITAVPFNRDRQTAVSPLMTDSRGIQFSDKWWCCVEEMSSMPNYHREVTGGDYQLWQLVKLQQLAQKFTESHAGHAPASFYDYLDDIQTSYSQAYWQGYYLEDKGETLRGYAPYIIRYSAPSADAPDRYALSATCGAYGQECIRSYLLDDDGVIHGTPEPHPANSQDPPILPCETDTQLCKDVEWPSPDVPSRIQVLIASVRHELNSTSLWFPAKAHETSTQP
jgi:hypothetical protein